MRNLGFAAKNGVPGQAALVLLISAEVTTLYSLYSLLKSGYGLTH